MPSSDLYKKQLIAKDMTKKNLIIVILLLLVIDLMAAGWYTARRIEASGRSQNLFDQRDSTEYIAMADTMTTASQADLFDKPQHNSYYFTSNTPSIQGDESSYYTSIKHVKVRWPLKVNGNDDLTELNKELIKKAFGNSQSTLKDARYVFLNSPSFNKPMGDDYRTLVKAPRVYPVYGNVSQVLVYPYMTSQRLLVMEIDKVDYNGSMTVESSTYVHYDRMKQRLLSRLDILLADVDKENKLLKVINKKIDQLNKGRAENNLLQHALNVPAEVRCGKNGIVFQYKHGSISNDPIDIHIDYDQLKPYITKDFEQLLENNEGYWLYKNEEMKPEPLNASAAVAPKTKAPAAAKSYDGYKKSGKSYKKDYKGYKKSYRGYKKNYRRYKKQNDDGNSNTNSSGEGTESSVKPKQTSSKAYSGAKRKSGYRGYSGKRRSSRRRH